MKLSRRDFLRNVSVAGGALTIGFSLTGCSDIPLPNAGENVFSPNAFLSISSSGEIEIQIHRTEMGQGVVTGLITLIAEELEVDPRQVKYQMAPVHPAYNNSEYMLQLTGGSNSIRTEYLPLRRAGAAARGILLRAAAADSGLPLEQLSASSGIVSSVDGTFQAAYGDLVRTAITIPIAKDVTLKPDEQLKLIGKYDRRVDAREKSNGTAVFGIDVQIENCATAVLVRSPNFGGKLLDFDAAQAKQHPGVIDIFAIDQGVAVVAEGYWPARKAAQMITANFSATDHPLDSSEKIRQAMSDAFAEDDFANIRDDNAENSLPEVQWTEAEYHVPFLAHATMEPQNATARVTADHCDVWVGTQSPDIARDAAAGALGRSRDSVTVHNHLMGGGFGRRIAADNVAEVVAIARRIDRPVKLIWSREDDTRNDFYRPAMAGQLRAKVGADGSVSAWRHRIVGPSVSQQIAPQFGKTMLPGWVPEALPALAGNFMATRDASSVEGAKELPYRFDGIEVGYHNLETAVPLGFWRSVGHSHTAFVVESFVDELAHKAGLDPLQFRLKNLAPDSKERRILEAVAEMAGWGKPAQGRFQGIAVHESFHSVVAEVAEISISNGKPKLEQFFCAVDCGRAINPDIVRDQMEGGIVFGLTAALHGKITLDGGAVKQSNFHDYQMLRHNEMPEVHVKILPGNAEPTGVGEPGTPPAAPALANAIFAATGKRHRELPLRLS